MVKYLDKEDRIRKKEWIAIGFRREKTEPRDKDGLLKNRDFFRQLWSDIDDAGTYGFYEFEEDLWRYLEDAEPEIRGEAISSLGYPTRLNIESFNKGKAYEIWNNLDETLENRRRALSCWHTAYFDTKNPKVLEILYKIATTDRNVVLRVQAFMGILEVGGIYITAAAGVAYDGIFSSPFHRVPNRRLDWEKAHAIMRQYAPNAPLVTFEDLPKDDENKDIEWENPDDDLERRQEILWVWSMCYRSSQDPILLEQMYKTFTQNPSLEMRFEAANAILRLGRGYAWEEDNDPDTFFAEGANPEKIVDLKEYKKLGRKLPWEEVHAVMHKCAPNVPLASYESRSWYQ